MTTTTLAETLAVNGTTLYVERRGEGSPLVLIHGGGEDTGMLAPQAESLAAAGFEVVTYDRRGTGRSGRQDWPGRGADQHAADAAALVDALGWRDPTVVGVSSGGVIALALASLHPDTVGASGAVVAWEPPAVGIVPGGVEATAAIMAPIDAHLLAHPGDYVGAQAMLLSVVLGFPVSADDPDFAAARANAEPFIRDEPAITMATLEQELLAGAAVSIAIGSTPNEIVAAAADVLAEWTGQPSVRADAEHEVYLTDPEVLTALVTTLTASS
jgi:pimeloyl-ACP methyl ester carboxylesterase